MGNQIMLEESDTRKDGLIYIRDSVWPKKTWHCDMQKRILFWEIHETL